MEVPPHGAQGRFPGREARGATEFIEDVCTILELPDEVRADLLTTYLIEVASEKGPADVEHDEAFATGLARLRKAGLRWMDVYQAFRALYWFYQELAEGGAQRLHDMLDGERDPQRASGIEALISARFEGKFPSEGELQAQAAQEAAEVGVLPSFDDLQSTEELRGVFVDTGADTTLMSFVPIASIRIDLDSGSPPSISFQATRRDVADLVAKLEQVERNLNSLARAGARALDPQPEEDRDQ